MRTLAFLIVLFGAGLAAAQDIPTVEADAPFTVPAVEAKTYPLRYPVVLVFRYTNKTPIVQHLAMARAAMRADGTLDVLEDPAEYEITRDVDVRELSTRSPVVKDAVAEIVRVLGLAAREKQLTEERATMIADSTPELVFSTVQIDEQIAAIRAALQIIGE